LEAEHGGVLDDYVEAHVHGIIDFKTDVEALVLDPCYRGTAIEDQARALGAPLAWHDGFRVTVEVVRQHPDFRGRRIVSVAAAIADNGRLNARIVGQAANSGAYHPQDVKKVWHNAARYGWHW
jgi:hypothetical protein